MIAVLVVEGLADKVAKATGPIRLSGPEIAQAFEELGFKWGQPDSLSTSELVESAFRGSLDATLALVDLALSGWAPCVSRQLAAHHPRGETVWHARLLHAAGGDCSANAGTPALALLSALLSALAAARGEAS